MKGNRVNPPLQLKLPQSIASNTDLKKAFDDLTRVVDQLWRRTGAGDDYVQNEKLKQLYSFTMDSPQKQDPIRLSNTSKTNNTFLQRSATKTENVILQQSAAKQNNVQLQINKPVNYTEKLVITDVNFTTTESMTIICDNDLSDINISLNPTPEDNEIVFIKKIGSKNINIVSVSPIDGQASININIEYESLMIRYIGKLNQWLIT